MENRISCNHIGIFTNNPYRLIDFYRKFLGFRREKEEILSKKISKKIFGINERFIFVKLRNNKLIIELFSPVKKKLDHKFNSTGYNHIGLNIINRDKFINQLKRHKVKTIIIKRNSHRVYFVLDPDKNLIELKEG